MRKKLIIIFLSVYGAFHLGLVGFTFYANSVMSNSDIPKLLDLSKQIPMTRWLALFGVLLFLIGLGIFYQKNRLHNKEIHALEASRDKYKAKMYDMIKEADNSKGESEVPVDSTGDESDEKPQS